MYRFWLSLSFLAAIAVLELIAPPSGQADPYKWCATYGSGRGGGARNCGFVSFEQCLQTIHGMGGFCERNLFYSGPAEQPVKHHRKRYND